MHLKAINKKHGVCGSEGQYSKYVFDVSCKLCLEIVIEKRLYELSLINQAINARKAIKEITKVKYTDVIIRHHQ